MSRSLTRLVIFDMDGTLTRPTLDFPRIRAEIGLPEPLLESMMVLPPGPAKEKAFRILERFEEEAAEISELNDDVPDILGFLASRGTPAALVTRNSRRSVDLILRKHALSFPVVVTRDDAPAKPRPEPLWLICKTVGVEPAGALMVGDFKLDVLAGRNAGTRTALLTNGRQASFLPEAPPDHIVARLGELKEILG